MGIQGRDVKGGVGVKERVGIQGGDVKGGLGVQERVWCLGEGGDY